MIRPFILVFVILLAGALITYIAHTFGFHTGLAHMNYTQWWQYVVESIVYSISYCLILTAFDR